jgi:cytidyltransferase-like protein
MSKPKYALYIGRFQPFHGGHLWLFNQSLKLGKKVWIGIRDVEPDENNPWTAHEVLMNLSKELHDLINEGKIFISIIPDIESINYGRGVGYDVIEHVPPQEIGEISATSIREQMRKDGLL